MMSVYLWKERLAAVIMNSAVTKFCVLSVLLGTLVSTGTYAIPVSSRIEEYNQELIDHLANLKAHVQSPSVRKLLKAVKENTEDVNVAVFAQNLLDSQSQDMTDQNAFGDKEVDAVLAAFQSLPAIAKVQTFISCIVPSIFALGIGFLTGRLTG